MATGKKIGIDIRPYPAADHRYLMTKSSIILYITSKDLPKPAHDILRLTHTGF